MAYQGAFPAESFHKSGLPKELFHVDGVEAYGRFNFLKTGLHFADVITTVSRKYADEISSSEEYGSGLMGLLSKRKKDLHGILNGIDYNVWNPAADDLIYRKYDVKSLDAKLDNKRALADRFHLPFKESMPIIGAISRMVEQKGFDLVLEVMEDLLKMNVQFILLGDGDKATEKRFETIQKKYPQQIGVFFGFDKELAHLIEAGSDLFVMPSRYEPCGLNQMYSMRYGTIPVVRATGGLDDTVEDYSGGGKGTGFKFEKYEGKELLKAFHRALKVYQQPEEWKRVMRNGMSKDFSWEHSARHYVNLYKELLKQ
jgi:starch synthase